MSWWGSGVTASRVLEEIGKAIEKPTRTYRRGDRAFSIEGDAALIETFEGPRAFIDGTLHLEYRMDRVLSLNFRDKWAAAYLDSSGNDVSSVTWYCARNACRLAGLPGAETSAITYSLSRWTPLSGEPAQERYASRMPWCKDGGVLWEKFSMEQANHYYECRYKLNDGLHHWFVYDWDDQGVWSMRYIDDRARRLHEKREKIWKRKSERMGTPTKITSTT